MLLRLFVAMLIFGAFQKVLFLLSYFGQTAELSLRELWGVFRYGLTLDISTACYVLALPWLLALVVLIVGSLRRGAAGDVVGGGMCRVIVRCYLVVIAAIAAIITTTDLQLYSHWGYRIDATLLPYLTSPTEAAASLALSDFAIAALLFFFVGGVALWLFWRATEDAVVCRVRGAIGQVAVGAGWILLGGLIFLGIRGGVSESVANVSKVYFCNNSFANHAAVNPIFSLMSSVGKAERYGEMYRFFEDEQQAQSNFHRAITQQKERESGRVVGGRVVKKGVEQPNIVIIIAEGFTRAIMEMEVDGREVMPQLRKIADEGLDFSRVYASGSRTDKGVVSVLSGFPAQPKLSIMKLPSKSRNLPSLARSLGEEGYGSSFYYGGDLDFMNMSSYLYSTGWQRLVWGDEVSMKIRALNSKNGGIANGEKHSKSQWGWRDEAMGVIFAEDVIAMNEASKKPFVATWLTLSSHKPFDVGRDCGFNNPMLNSMAYSDSAVGECVEMLRRSEVWDDLLVVIVADHTLGGYGGSQSYQHASQYRIPLVMTGGALGRKGSVGSYMSQHDLAATLLGALGVESGDFTFSRDVFARGYKGYGYYVFNDGFGVVSGSGSVVYDNTLGAAVAKEGATAELLVAGKAILQQTHTSIDQM